MEAKRINLEEWDYFGEGGSGKSYCNKKNGNILLKLNGQDIPEETSFREFCSLKYFFENGLPVPEVYDFVTDGKCFGYTAQRIKGKLSIARILSQEPDKTDMLAAAFAGHALTLHSTDADETKVSDAIAGYRELFGDLSFVPEDVAETVRRCLDGLVSRPTLLHGDMNPGNMISFEGRNYWIGVNDLKYGDPYLDIATMYVICYCMSPKSVSRLYHASVRTFRKFFESFGKAYFGHSWNSSWVEHHIWNAVIVKCCALIKANPKLASQYVPFIRGQKLLFSLRRLLAR